ncbi:hypothetical protein AB6A40_001630 [Gnathostoma spinigerum]|uniref:Uncharacterized protein n=1 Tax=Gnathostoma spinigerum TaxID=75299 RepID=A0ABD6EC02_9BILA
MDVDPAENIRSPLASFVDEAKRRLDDYSFLMTEAYCNTSVVCPNCVAMKDEISTLIAKVSALVPKREAEVDECLALVSKVLVCCLENTTEVSRRITELEVPNRYSLAEDETSRESKIEAADHLAQFLELTNRISSLADENAILRVNQEKLEREKESAVKDFDDLKFVMELQLKKAHEQNTALHSQIRDLEEELEKAKFSTQNGLENDAVVENLKMELDDSSKLCKEISVQLEVEVENSKRIDECLSRIRADIELETLNRMTYEENTEKAVKDVRRIFEELAKYFETVSMNISTAFSLLETKQERLADLLRKTCVQCSKHLFFFPEVTSTTMNELEQLRKELRRVKEEMTIESGRSICLQKSLNEAQTELKMKQDQFSILQEEMTIHKSRYLKEKMELETTNQALRDEKHQLDLAYERVVTEVETLRSAVRELQSKLDISKKMEENRQKNFTESRLYDSLINKDTFSITTGETDENLPPTEDVSLKGSEPSQTKAKNASLVKSQSPSPFLKKFHIIGADKGRRLLNESKMSDSPSPRRKSDQCRTQ